MVDSARKKEGEFVSVIVPVYNGERFLPTCIGSIVRQTHRDLELILVNDGSSDGSGALCEDYAKKDGRIRVIHTANRGPAAARNAGMQQARGDFFFFLDADDYIELDALRILLDSYGQTGADVVVGDFRKVKASQTNAVSAAVFSESRVLQHQDIVDYARRYLKKPNRNELFSYSWGRLFRSAVIRDHQLAFNPELHTYEDVSFNYNYLVHANAVSYVSRTIYNHLIHDSYASARTMMNGNPRILFGYQQALLEIGAYFRYYNVRFDIRKELGHAFVFLTIIQLVRTCGQLSRANYRAIHRVVKDIVKSSAMREAVRWYAPEKGDSKLLPVLMKLGLIWPILLVSKYKAYKRYRNSGGAK